MKKFLVPIFTFLFIAFFLLIPKSAQAVTFTYNPTLDEVDGTVGILKLTMGDLTTNEFYTLCGNGLLNLVCTTFKAPSSQYTIDICGNGDSLIKTNCGGSDYFHEGKTYEFQIYEGQADLGIAGEPKNFNELDLLKEVRLYINYYYPEVDVSKQGDQIVVSVSGKTKPGGAERNNYKIEFPLYAGNSDRVNEHNDCLQIGSTSTFSPAEDGDYVIEIREQIDEGADPFSSACSGGFIYWKYTCTIEDGTLTCKRVQDPEGRDRGGFGAGQNPCTAGGCETAFGNLSVNLSEFAQNALKIATGIAGGLAFILMVIGAIRVLTSSGDQQRLNGGREMIIAALVGLLFIIFSVLILEFLGINIIGLS